MRQAERQLSEVARERGNGEHRAGRAVSMMKKAWDQEEELSSLYGEWEQTDNLHSTTTNSFSKN